MKPVAAILFLALLPGPRAMLGAEEWEVILDKALRSEHSQTRQDGLKQIDTTTVKGLRALWKVLAIRDWKKVDWYVRQGAYEALLRAEGPEAEAEIERVLAGAEDELAREAIVYAAVWRLRRDVIRATGGNDDRLIQEAKEKLRKARGVEYFALTLPVIRESDPEKKHLKRIHRALADKSPRVRRAALNGLAFYPDESSIPLLLAHLKGLEKQKTKQYREWVLTRNALEVLSGQYYRDSVEDWHKWWEITKEKFSLEKRVEEEKPEEGEGGEASRTVVVRRQGVEVRLNMKIAGAPEGYPLLVVPRRGMEPDYFRPYFHGVEEICKVYYLQIPQLGDFKGLRRDEKSNLVVYPTKILAAQLVGLMEDSKLERFGVLAHGPDACVLSTMLLAHAPEKVTHLVLINPRSAGSEYGKAIENVRREGLRTQNQEIVKGADFIVQLEDGTTKYKPADDDEEAGLHRALYNLRSADPTEPETGDLFYLFGLPGGTSAMADEAWSTKSILAGMTVTTPVLIFMGLKSVWTPLSDMKRVSGLFKNARVVEMKESSEMPFISETALFTREIQSFFKGAKVMEAGAQGETKTKKSRNKPRS